MRIVFDGGVLGDVWLAFPQEKNVGDAGVNGDVGAVGAGADRLSAGGALGDDAGDGGDADEFAAWLSKEVGEGNGVIDVGTNVGIEEYGDALGHIIRPFQ